ncbi:MAG: glycogen synthase GlgA [Gammaproteobacteria bacterium]|nr:glycogen synthase GlgA [Gammaproteobacteria bacterium]
MTHLLFAVSEAHPLIKTGGLADVACSLPRALQPHLRTLRLIMPAYRQAIARAGQLKPIATLQLAGFTEPVRILEGKMTDSGITLWLVDAPAYFDREGGPYGDTEGIDWPDNAARFTLFARAVVEIACGRAGLGWQPDIVHCNDWQTGLVPALLQHETVRPATVFTIHNLAYQGQFEAAVFPTLALPASLWGSEGLEFYGRLSFLKGGIAFADRLTTVSPTYAREIQTPELGYGLEGLLAFRATRLTGILNGADYTQWEPAHDAFIEKPYDIHSLHLKAVNKRALQRSMGLPHTADVPLLGMIGRLVEQKGIDLLLAILPSLLQQPVQLAVLGSGEKKFEQVLLEIARRHPHQIAVYIGYSEELAHRIEAGADMFLMPSRFEPCGLNQIYSLRYGTVPIVRHTGGLADSVVDATPGHLQSGTATGFVFDATTPEALLHALQRALALYHQPVQWRKVVACGMQQDFSWGSSTDAYLEVYRQALADRGTPAPV